MDSLYNSFYNYMSTTVVPTVTAGATQLADGAALVINTVSQTALDWTSGSEDAIGSAEVFSWEQRRQAPITTEESPSSSTSTAPGTSSQSQEPPVEEANTSSEWEVVDEDPEITGPRRDDKFELVQNDYKWMKEN